MVTPLPLEAWVESTEDTELDSSPCVATLARSVCSEPGLVSSGVAPVPLVVGLAVLGGLSCHFVHSFLVVFCGLLFCCASSLHEEWLVERGNTGLFDWCRWWLTGLTFSCFR